MDGKVDKSKQHDQRTEECEREGCFRRVRGMRHGIELLPSPVRPCLGKKRASQTNVCGIILVYTATNGDIPLDAIVRDQVKEGGKGFIFHSSDENRQLLSFVACRVPSAGRG